MSACSRNCDKTLHRLNIKVIKPQNRPRDKKHQSMIRKAVIPAAGFGTRFLPATKSQPKEMLPIVDTPVIQYVVEEAVQAGITDLLMIIGKGKRSIEEHFDRSFQLESQLEATGQDRRAAGDAPHLGTGRHSLRLAEGDARPRRRRQLCPLPHPRRAVRHPARRHGHRLGQAGRPAAGRAVRRAGAAGDPPRSRWSRRR